MSTEDVTQGTRYFNALRDVADAARKVEEIRVRYDDALDQLTRERIAAEKELRAALERAAELTGETLPLSRRDRNDQRLEKLLDGLKKKDEDA